MQIAGAATCESFVRLPDRPVRRPVLAIRIAPVRIKSGSRDQTIPAYEVDPGGGLFPASSAGDYTDSGWISLARNRYRPDSLRRIALRAMARSCDHRRHPVPRCRFGWVALDRYAIQLLGFAAGQDPQPGPLGNIALPHDHGSSRRHRAWGLGPHQLPQHRLADSPAARRFTQELHRRRRTARAKGGDDFQGKEWRSLDWHFRRDLQVVAGEQSRLSQIAGAAPDVGHYE